MRFAARETAVFGQIEPAFGLIPGGGAAQYLVRVMGRARALEVLLSADDCDAELAERSGWINRALAEDTLAKFVARLAHRTGSPMISVPRPEDRQTVRCAPGCQVAARRNGETRLRLPVRIRRGSQRSSSRRGAHGRDA